MKKSRLSNNKSGTARSSVNIVLTRKQLMTIYLALDLSLQDVQNTKSKADISRAIHALDAQEGVIPWRL